MSVVLADAALSMARVQFGLLTIFHFFFVPITIGLAWLLAIMQTAWRRTGDEDWLRLTRFFGTIFLINFAIGVATGLVQEFQFGMNWSTYSRFVGDVFGAPLAVEALLAFFLESTFLGVWIFGWERLSKRAHLAAIWLVAIGSNISALWILIANSFMQQPVGYVVRNGRAEMTDFFALILNPNVWVQFPHVLAAGLVTASFFVMGISAWHLLRRSNLDLFRRSFQIGATVGLIAIVLTILNGHTQAQHMVETQPMKMAAAEGLFKSENPASFSLFTIGDLSGRREVFSLRLPDMLSLLAYNQLSGEVQGINDLQAEYEREYGPGNYVPPAWVVYWSFRGMVGAGFLMLALAAYGLFLTMSEALEKKPRWLGAFVWAIFLPYLANSTGWLMAEVGREPWVVFGLMKVQDGVSPTVSAGMLLVSLIGYTLVYGALMVVTIGLLRRFAREVAPSADSGDSSMGTPSLVGAD
jgi:cytochrome d ubiquinol oxidase subunit I